jgi:hypothetical protein
MKSIFVTMSAILLFAAVAFAEVGDFECMPHTPGFYLQGYPTFTTASKTYDADGESQDLTNNWTGFGFSLRPAYCGMLNNHRWNITAVLPYQSIDPGLGKTQSGVGDMQFSATYWLWDSYNKWHNFSIWFWTDVPTGDEDKGLGTGQMNIRPGLAYCWDKYPYQMQTSAFYNLRMENSDTKIKPGDEIWFNWAFGYSFQPNLMASAEIETGWGQDEKLNSTSVPDSKQTWFKVGPSVQYQLMPNLGFKVKGLYNAFGANSGQTLDVWARFEWTFNK